MPAPRPGCTASTRPATSPTRTPPPPPAPTTLTYGYDDASELESKSGSITGWTYDKAGNETSAAPGRRDRPRRESWSDYNQLTSITAGGTAYQAKHAGTTNDERTKLGDTWFHHTQLGLASTTTGSTDTGFVREPGGAPSTP